MEKEITIDEKTKGRIKEIIRDAHSGRNNLYGCVAKEFEKGTRISSQEISYLETFETAMGIFRETALKIRENIDVLSLEERLRAIEAAVTEKPNEDKDKDRESVKLKEEIAEAIMFSNKYSLYFAGSLGLALLNSEKSTTAKRMSFSPEDYSSKERDNLCSKLATIAVDDLSFVVSEKRNNGSPVNEEDLKYTLESIFTTWVNQFNWRSFDKLTGKYKLEDLTLKFGNYSVMGAQFKKKSTAVEIDSKFMRVKKSDVVGNEKYVSEVWRNMMKLLAWNEEKQDNPLDPPVAIFTYGEPGGGKTFTAHALIQEIGEVCRRAEIPLLAFPLSITDFGSKYQNETPNQYKRQVIDRIIAHKGPTIMYIADADTIFPSRENKDSSNEDDKLAGVVFSTFDGSIIPKGKLTALMDANFIDKMDDATKNRLLSAKFLELKRFEKPEEFAIYTRNYMTKGTGGIGVADPEWLEIGKYLLESQLSNREIANLLKNLRGDFDVPEEVITKPYDEIVRFRNEYMKSITKDVIIQKCEDYRNTRMDVERKSLEKRRRKQMEQLLVDLQTDPRSNLSESGSIGG